MNEKEEILELYKLHSNFAQDITKIRQQIHKFYISLLSLIMTFVTFLEIKNLLLNNILIICFFCPIPILICFFWYMNIDSYKKLNIAKFKMLNKLENKLTLKPYKIELCYLIQNKYLELTYIEQKIPIIFSLPFLFYMIFKICNYFN